MTERASLCVLVHGVSVAMVFEGEERVLQPFLSQFERSDRGADLTITVAEHEGRGEPLDPAEWQPRFFFGVIQGYVGARGYALSDVWSRAVIDVRERSVRLSLARLPDGRSPTTTSGVVHAALCLALREWRRFELHAAAVCDDRSAYLIVGNSGAGKTSFALAMLADDCRYLGDDRTLLFSDEDRSLVLGAYPRSFHVAVATAAAFPSVLSQAQSSEGIGGKLALAPEVAFSQKLQRSWRGPIALLLPKVTRAERTEIEPASSADALGALLESSALAWVDGVRFREENLAILGSLADSAPAFRLSLAKDALDDPRATARRVREFVWKFAAP